MNRPLLSLAALSTLATLQAAPQDRDVLLFQNGDTLHGTFQDITPDRQITWLRNGWKNPATFPKKDLHQIVFNQGKSHQPLTTQSSIHLNNGDIIAGDIIQLSSSEAIIDTAFAGKLTLPRKFISRIQPTLFNGELIYQGPTEITGWEVVLERSIKPPEENDEDEKEDAVDEKEEEFDLNAEDPPPPPLEYDLKKLKESKENESTEPSWLYQSASWYATGTRPLVCPFNLPDQVKIRFTLEWSGHLATSIVLHGSRPQNDLLAQATTPKPKAPKKENDEAGKEAAPNIDELEEIQLRLQNNLRMQQLQGNVRQAKFSHAHYPHSFKKSYILNLSENYISLQRSSLDRNNQPSNEMVSTDHTKLPIKQHGRAEVEIRCDRDRKLIALFVDGRFVTQWIDSAGYFAQGDCLALCKNRSDSKVRLSQFLVTSWDGNMDSANSMDHPERDVLITNNGTDRYSGTLESIQDNTAQLNGSYAKLNIPLDKLLDIRLARKQVAPDPQQDEDAEPNPAHSLATFAPHGRLTLELKNSQNGTLTAIHPLLGELTINPAHFSTLHLNHHDTTYLKWDF